MMPLGAPSISKYGSLVRPDAQIVACAHTARALRLRRPQRTEVSSLTRQQGDTASATKAMSVSLVSAIVLCGPYLLQYSSKSNSLPHTTPSLCEGVMVAATKLSRSTMRTEDTTPGSVADFHPWAATVGRRMATASSVVRSW